MNRTYLNATAVNRMNLHALLTFRMPLKMSLRWGLLASTVVLVHFVALADRSTASHRVASHCKTGQLQILKSQDFVFGDFSHISAYF